MCERERKRKREGKESLACNSVTGGETLYLLCLSSRFTIAFPHGAETAQDRRFLGEYRHSLAYRSFTVRALVFYFVVNRPNEGPLSITRRFPAILPAAS